MLLYHCERCASTHRSRLQARTRATWEQIAPAIGHVYEWCAVAEDWVRVATDGMQWTVLTRPGAVLPAAPTAD